MVIRWRIKRTSLSSATISNTEIKMCVRFIIFGYCSARLRSRINGIYKFIENAIFIIVVNLQFSFYRIHNNIELNRSFSIDRIQFALSWVLKLYKDCYIPRESLGAA